MKQKKKYLKICIGIVLFCMLGSWFFYREGGNSLFLGKLQLSNITDLSADRNENLYIVNHSGNQLVRADGNGIVNLILKEKQMGSEAETIKDAAADAEGNIYVHTVFSTEEALSWFGGEYICLYDSAGHFQKAVYENIYDTPRVSPSLIRMQAAGENVYAIFLEEDQILVRNLTSGEKNGFSFPEAAHRIQCAVYKEAENAVIAYTKDGKLLSIGRQTETIYETEADGLDEIVFSDLSMDQEGNLYLSNAGTGALYRFADGALEAVAAVEEYLITKMDCSSAFVLTDGFSVQVGLDGEAEYYESLSLSPVYCFCHAACMVCMAVGVVGLCILAAVLLVWLLTKSSRRTRSLALIASLIGAVSIGICTYFAVFLKDIYRENIVEMELTAAKNVNVQLDKEAFARLTSVTDFDSENYRKVKEAADSIMLDEDGVPGKLYLLMYTYENEECLYVRYSEDEDYGCNYPYYYSEDDAERQIYRTGEPAVFDMISDGTGVFQSIYYPITNEQEEVIGIIEVGCDLTALNRSIAGSFQGLFISIAILCIVLLMIILEFVEFAEGRKELDPGSLKRDGGLLPVKLYRLAVFLIFFLTNITTPFLAAYALKLSQNLSSLPGVSPEILAAVPISAEVVSGALFSFLGSGIIRKLGSRKAGLLGSSLFTAGLFIRVIYPDLLCLTAGNLVQGAGWGIVLLIINARLAAVEDESLQESGFTDYNIAVENGVNSGVIFGGFLLAYTGYQAILLIAAVLSISVLVYSFFLIYNEKGKKEAEVRQGNLGDSFRFLASPRVFLYFLLIVLPVISASYYLNYLYPILADQLGMQEDWIGYSYLLNGMVTICFSRMINDFVAKRIKDKKIQLMLSSLIYLVMFGLVGYFENLYVLLISLVLMAVTCSFGYMAQSTFYSELKEVEELGYEKAMGIYSLFENLAQAAGSFLFGYALILGVKRGLLLFGMAIAGCGLLFALLVTIYEKKQRKAEK